MTIPAVVMPDTAKVVIRYLRQVFAGGDVTVGNRRVLTGASLRVQRVGGVKRTRVSDQANVVIEARDVDQPAATALIEQARAAVAAMPGAVDGAYVYRTREVTGVTEPADEDRPDRGRADIVVAVHLRGVAFDEPEIEVTIPPGS